jgi:transposase
MPAPSIIKGRPMNHSVGIDVSLEASSACVVDGNGKIVREGKIVSEPNALIAWLARLKQFAAKTE